MPDISQLIAQQKLGNLGIAIASIYSQQFQYTWNDGALQFVGESINYTDTASLATSEVWERRVNGAQVAYLVKNGDFAAARFSFTNASNPFSWTMLFQQNNIIIVKTYAQEVAGFSGQQNALMLTQATSVAWVNSAGSVDAAISTRLTQYSPGLLAVSNNVPATGPGGIRTNPYTFATLPAAATAGAGARCCIADGAATPVWDAPAAGGGSHVTPVFSDGVVWRNG